MSNICIENLTIKEAREIAALFSKIEGESPKSTTRIEGDRRDVIVRARDAGVHYGKLVAYEGRTVWLENARRLWSWIANDGVALNGVAINGINASKSKIDALVPAIIILDACEIIDASAKAVSTIEAA